MRNNSVRWNSNQNGKNPGSYVELPTDEGQANCLMSAVARYGEGVIPAGLLSDTGAWQVARPLITVETGSDDTTEFICTKDSGGVVYSQTRSDSQIVSVEELGRVVCGHRQSSIAWDGGSDVMHGCADGRCPIFPSVFCKVQGLDALQEHFPSHARKLWASITKMIYRDSTIWAIAPSSSSGKVKLDVNILPLDQRWITEAFARLPFEYTLSGTIAVNKAVNGGDPNAIWQSSVWQSSVWESEAGRQHESEALDSQDGAKSTGSQVWQSSVWQSSVWQSSVWNKMNDVVSAKTSSEDSTTGIKIWQSSVWQVRIMCRPHYVTCPGVASSCHHAETDRHELHRHARVPYDSRPSGNRTCGTPARARCGDRYDGSLRQCESARTPNNYVMTMH